MTKKRFYYLLGCHPQSAHPGRFEITELRDVNKIRVLWISLLLMFKNESILCVDTRDPAHCRMGRAGANMRLELLQKTYQRWYKEWQVGQDFSKFKRVEYKDFELNSEGRAEIELRAEKG